MSESLPGKRFLGAAADSAWGAAVFRVVLGLVFAFPDHPPRYVRTPTFEYRFSDRGSADWWTRAPEEAFCPPLALQDGRLRRAVLPGE